MTRAPEMKTTETQQWLYLLFFTIAGTVVFGLVYILAALFIPPADDARDYYAGVVGFTEKYIGQTPLELPPRDEVYQDFFALKTNDTVRIDNYRVIYKGLEPRGRFALEIANTQLDAQTYYSYSFESDKVADGIRIGNQRFRVLSARDTILHLQRIRP